MWSVRRSAWCRSPRRSSLRINRVAWPVGAPAAV